MIVIAKQNIDSFKYGIVLEGVELEVEDKVGETWLKQGVAYGKSNGKGAGSVEGEAKERKPKSNT
jgi:hypothetical protein